MSSPQPGGSNPTPPLYDTGASGVNAYNTTGSLGGYNFFDPSTASSLSYGIVNNPYQGQFQQGAGVAGQLGQGGGLNTYGAGANLYNTGGILGQNVLANQPGGQQPLYNFLQNQNLQQANAENAMAGIATTPYGAGVADQSNQLFNLNWQNFLQQQQLAAAQGQNQAYQGAFGLQSQAPGQYLAGAGLPYGTANQIAGTGIGALGGLTGYGQQASQIPTTQAQLYGNYAIGGNQANTSQFNAAVNQGNIGFQEAMAPYQLVGQILGAGAGGLGYGYGKSLGGGGGGGSADLVGAI